MVTAQSKESKPSLTISADSLAVLLTKVINPSTGSVPDQRESDPWAAGRGIQL